ncbi:hypothetical protein [Quadrisphaera sp. INWT6]|uniref:hypothetical protein n=1 Tax=Quadrisphaera sp. INWT6 TaxID=2596917 RepID=UPI0018920AB6|nr:hypothetical protein [Quadrisphaera sp. INWT6]MBF5082620.1 hypothetical protein [Quadrisphaera sp. INWT6]
MFRWGLRVWRHPAFTLDVACVDRASVRWAGWWTALNASTTVRRVSVTTREGVLVDLSLPVEDVEVQLAEQQVPVSGLERLRVRTTDAHAVGGEHRRAGAAAAHGGRDPDDHRARRRAPRRPGTGRRARRDGSHHLTAQR